VLSVKLYALASVLERVMLQSIVLLLFAALSQQVLRRIPHGLRRSTNAEGCGCSSSSLAYICRFVPSITAAGGDTYLLRLRYGYAATVLYRVLAPR